jgi:catechol 2,3-dioxygenase-like lactoylglutathione lyase family enzyme
MKKLDISRIIIFVSNLEKMRDFYQTAFGLERLDDGSAEGFITLNAGACQISLHELPGEPESAEACEDSYIKFVFGSGNIEADRLFLEKHGARMRKTIRCGEIEFCDGLDPEGNVFQISTRNY